MSKFNQTATTKVNNYENGINYLNDAKIELSSIVLNATMSGDSFYEKPTSASSAFASLLIPQVHHALGFVGCPWKRIWRQNGYGMWPHAQPRFYPLCKLMR